MSKNKIIIVLLMMLSIGIVSLYTTYAYEENNVSPDNIPINSDNIIMSIKNSTSKEINIGPNEEKFFEINITNEEKSTIRYGIYYFMIEPQKLPDNVSITLAEDSEDALENIIKPGNRRSISLRITNNSEYSIDLILGALAGYEKGKPEDLIKSGEVLIK